MKIIVKGILLRIDKRNINKILLSKLCIKMLSEYIGDYLP